MYYLLNSLIHGHIAEMGLLSLWLRKPNRWLVWLTMISGLVIDTLGLADKPKWGMRALILLGLAAATLGLKRLTSWRGRWIIAGIVWSLGLSWWDGSMIVMGVGDLVWLAVFMALRFKKEEGIYLK